MKANDIRKGQVIKVNGDLFTVLWFAHRTPGNLRAFVQVKLRNLRSGVQSGPSRHDPQLALAPKECSKSQHNRSNQAGRAQPWL